MAVLEELKTIEPIPLDFYNNNIRVINAKQLDTKSRYIKISCTEHGKKVILNPQTMTAYIATQKPDGYYILNECQILDEGNLLVELTQQMLAVPGKSEVQVILISGAESGDATIPGIEVTDDGNGNVTVTSIDSFVQSVYESGGSVLSTMSFYLNVFPIGIDSKKIESSYEYNGLIDGLQRLNTTKIKMEALEETLTENEQERILNETERESAESTREIAESQREINVQNTIQECNQKVNDAVTECNTATSNANTATSNANSATTNAVTATNNANTATSNANTAANRANTAAEQCEGIIEGSNLIFQSEKGAANGVATLDADGKLPTEQLPNLKNGSTIQQTVDNLNNNLNTHNHDSRYYTETEINEKITALPKIYYGTADPDDSVGKDGDVYMKIIVE